MNLKNLHTLIERYEENIYELNDSACDEKFKWHAVQRFQDAWFAPDAASLPFSELFHRAIKGSAILINNSTVQPANGVVKLAEKAPAEVERLFRDVLFAEDQGDLALRQAHIEEFLDGMEALLQQYYPSSWKYRQDRHAATCYLTLYAPEKNYIYKFSPVETFAQYIEFGKDIGSGSSFSLSHYYELGDLVVAALQEHPTLLKKHDNLLDRTYYKDMSRHLLAFDIIYCADTYGYYTNLTHRSKKEAIKTYTLEQCRKNEEEQRQTAIAALEEQLQRIRNQLAVYRSINLVGTQVFQKSLGTGVVIQQKSNLILVRFEQCEGITTMTTMNTAELKKALETADIFSRNGFSREEYIEELLKFQSFASQAILDDENARMDEVIAAVSSAARKNGSTASPDFVAGIRGLKAIEKEIAIHMSGKRAEDEVAHSLSFVDRPFFQDFRNVYVADQETETEIDNVILTNNGVIVVEVKSAKHNITIGEDGRLLYSNSESYHNESIGDKMSAKRRLLKARIENGLRERGLDIPVYIDSYLVFVTPKRLEVTITDNFRKEHWCRRGKLQHIVNNYISDVTYSAEEYAQLAEVIESLDCNIRRFPTELDLPSIRNSFVALFSLIKEKPITTEVKPQTAVKVQPVQPRKAAPAEAKKRPANKWNIAGIAASAAVVLVASVAAVTAAVRSAS